jgi:hypothetical protein
LCFIRFEPGTEAPIQNQTIQWEIKKSVRAIVTEQRLRPDGSSALLRYEPLLRINQMNGALVAGCSREEETGFDAKVCLATVNFEAFQHDTSSPSAKVSSHFSDESKFVTDTEGNNSPLIIYSATSIFEAITRRARVQYVGVASS